MSYLFFIVSALIFIVGGAAVIGIYHNDVTGSTEISTTLIFIASGIFAIAGVLA